ncbi:hypothetical protein JW758_01540 [Candidatus Peregrinibacteria bacterium]|nr:hypothetical protein [Candidatus Peregrinibacteria bacterium]
MFNLKEAIYGPKENEKSPLSEAKSLLAGLTMGKVHTSAELDITRARLVKEMQRAKLGEVAKGARDELRATPEQQTILANIMLTVENDFIEKDIKKDLGIKDPQKISEYRKLFREYFREKMSNEMLLEIYASQEWEQLNVHVNEMAKYAKLDEIIATCKIEGNSGAWKVFAEKHPMLATAGSWIISWYIGDKKEKDMSQFDKKLASIASILSGEEPKKEEGGDKKAKNGEETSEAVAEADKVKLEDLDENLRATIKPLTDAGFPIDLDSLETDVKELKEQAGYDDEKLKELAETGASSESQFFKVAGAMQERMGVKTLEYKLSDVHVIEGLTEDQTNSIIEIIKKVDKSPEEMKKALTRIRAVKPNEDSAEIARHMEIAPESQTADASPETTADLG